MGSLPRPAADHFSARTGLCWCGCGTPVDGIYAPGHDVAAIAELISAHYGTSINLLLAHGYTPFAEASWKYAPREAATDEAVLAINRARRSGPMQMTLLHSDDPADIEWDAADRRKYPLLRDIREAGPRLALTFTDPYFADYQARRDAALEVFEQTEAAAGRHLPPRNTIAGAEARLTAPLPDSRLPLDAAIDRLEASGDPVAYEAALHAIVEDEPRDVDAWAHLGNHEWRLSELARSDRHRRDHYTRALTYYETAVGVAQLSMPPQFTHLTPWYSLGNRPFLRTLHGLTLAHWALEDTEQARALARDMLWLNPRDNQGIRYILRALNKRVAYTNFAEPDD